jgi:hypothetical protein
MIIKNYNAIDGCFKKQRLFQIGTSFSFTAKAQRRKNLAFHLASLRLGGEKML